MLGESIALIAIAAMFALEAYKVKERLPRLVLGGIAVVFALSGALLRPIVEWVPLFGAAVSGVFGDPVAWFALCVGLFFVIRPFWQAAPRLTSWAPPVAQQVGDFTSWQERIEEVLSEQSSRLQDLERKIETVQGSVDDQREARRRLRVIEKRRPDIQRALDTLPNVKEVVEAEFSTVMERLSRSRTSDLHSVQESPYTDIHHKISDWESRLSDIMFHVEEIGGIEFTNLTDCSAYREDPLKALIPAAREPEGLDQKLQSIYRRYAAQRDALDQRARQILGAIDREEARLRDITG